MQFSAPDFIGFAFNPINRQPYLSYSDSLYGRKATVMTFAGNAWAPLGSAGFTDGEAVDPKLAFVPNSSQLYMAFVDNYNGGKTSVLMHNGSSWSTVGNVGFSLGFISDVRIALEPNTSLPYVGYVDYSVNGKATVMKLDNATSTWVSVGSAGFTPGDVGRSCMAFQPNTSMLYYAYGDGKYTSRATVMAFDGTWFAVGQPGLSTFPVDSINMAFEPKSSVPYLAYVEDTNTKSGTTVSKFTGSSWTTVGPAFFSNRSAENINLAFHLTTSELWVAYHEFDYNTWSPYGPTVARFDGSTWVDVGQPNFVADTSASLLALAFQPSTSEPFVAFLNTTDLQSGQIAFVYKASTSPSPQCTSIGYPPSAPTITGAAEVSGALTVTLTPPTSAGSSREYTQATVLPVQFPLSCHTVRLAAMYAAITNYTVTATPVGGGNALTITDAGALQNGMVRSGVFGGGCMHRVCSGNGSWRSVERLLPHAGDAELSRWRPNPGHSILPGGICHKRDRRRAPLQLGFPIPLSLPMTDSLEVSKRIACAPSFPSVVSKFLHMR